MSLSRILANIGTALDSATTGDFLSKVDSDGVFGGVAYSSVTGTPTVLDSANVTNLIDSAYIQLRQTAVSGGGLDSATTISFVDSDYITSRATASGFQMFEYDATAGQTEFTGSDVNGNTLAYSEYGLLVHYNGILLSGATDYTATDGTTVVLTDSADADARITIAKWSLASAGGGAGAAAWYGDRGLFGGGNTGSYVNTIDYISIASPGNATDFGDMTIVKMRCAPASDATYGVWAGGYSSIVGQDNTYIQNIIDYVTISTTGNATDFGDLTGGFNYMGQSGCGDGTYGLFGAGFASSPSGASNIINYVTIASPGNATDFGDLTVARFGSGSFNDATYACWAGGNTSGNTIDYVTMASPGNATDFGDLTSNRNYGGGTGDTTYGLIAGGLNPNALSIDYVTIATPGNASDFGDLTVGRRYFHGCSDATYGVFGGGEQNDSPYSLYNVMDYVTIASPGNATDFGDLTSSRSGPAALSGSSS